MEGEIYEGEEGGEAIVMVEMELKQSGGTENGEEKNWEGLYTSGGYVSSWEECT